MKLTECINRLISGSDVPLRLYLIASPHKTMLRDISTGTNGYRVSLFDTTQLASLNHASPWLCEVAVDSLLLQKFNENARKQTNWQGILLLIPETLSFSELTAQLRNRLLVQFGDHQQGVLHYQLPNVIHYLLSEAPEQDTRHWMDAIKAVIWHSPLASVTGAAVWQTAVNSEHSEAPVLSDNTHYTLSEAQQSALKTGPIDQRILEWLSNHPANPDMDDFKRLRQAALKADYWQMLDNEELTSVLFQTVYQLNNQTDGLIEQLKGLTHPQRLSLLKGMQQQHKEGSDAI